MQNIKENKRIYLSGGGNETQSFPLDKFFFDTLPEGGRLLYIPVALRGHKLYPTAHVWMKSVTNFHKRADIQFETAGDLTKYNFKTLKNFDGIYIGGGNTWSLMHELKDSGFASILIQYIKAGGKVYGGSAGAIIMGNNINTHNDENTVGLEDMSGFDLLNNLSVACHFKDEQCDRFTAWAMDNNSPIMCLPEEAGLAIESGAATCVGTKPCVVYMVDGSKKNISPGESFNLKKVPMSL